MASQIEQDRAAWRRSASPRPAAAGPSGSGRVRSRPDGPSTVHALTLVAAGALLLWLNAGQWFQSDEFDFLANRGVLGQPELGLFAPHNEHWSTLPILLWRGLYSLVGMTTYWPYALQLVLLHLGVTHLLWRTAQRAGADPWVATALAAVFGVLGAGWENLLWAFQSAFVASLLAGLAHVALVDHEPTARDLGRRDALGVLAGVVALMCSGVGVTVVAAAGLAALLRRGWRAGLVAVGPPAAVFLTWFALAGRSGVEGSEFGPGTLGRLPGYVLRGLVTALDGLAGLPVIGAVLLGGLVVWAGVGVRANRRSGERPAGGRLAAPAALALGAVMFLAIAGAGRVDDPGDGTSSRYTYVVVALLLPALTVALSWAARRIPAGPRVALVGGLAVLMAVSGIATLHAEAARHAPVEQAWRGRIVAASTLAGLEPSQVVDTDVTRDLGLDELAAMRVDDRLPSIEPEPERRAEAAALLAVGTAEAPVGPFPAPELPAVVAVTGPDEGVADDGCLVVAAAPDRTQVALAFSEPGAVRLDSDGTGPIEVAVEDQARGTSVNRPRGVELVEDGPTYLDVGIPSTVTLTVPADARTILCGLTDARPN